MGLCLPRKEWIFKEKVILCGVPADPVVGRNF
jgi:hypothetical protein